MPIKPNQPAAGVMDEVAQSPAPEPAPAAPGGDQAQTAEIPVSMFGEHTPKEGDVFEFKVVSVDAQSGNVTVAYNTEEKPEGGGSDDMAAQFSKDNMQKGMI